MNNIVLITDQKQCKSFANNILNMNDNTCVSFKNIGLKSKFLSIISDYQPVLGILNCKSKNFISELEDNLSYDILILLNYDESILNKMDSDLSQIINNKTLIYVI